LATRPLRATTRIFTFQLNTCGYSPYVTSSLMRGWVCRLQLLLVLASKVILRSESRGTHDHILLSQIRDSPNPEGQVPVFISPRTGWPGYTPKHWVPFSSPPTARRATVEVYDPTSTRVSHSHSLFYSLYNFGKDQIEITTSNSVSIIVCLFVAAETCLTTCYPATDVLPLLTA
jgi:hypothetical protein